MPVRWGASASGAAGSVSAAAEAHSTADFDGTRILLSGWGEGYGVGGLNQWGYQYGEGYASGGGDSSTTFTPAGGAIKTEWLVNTTGSFGGAYFTVFGTDLESGQFVALYEGLVTSMYNYQILFGPPGDPYYKQSLGTFRPGDLLHISVPKMDLTSHEGVGAPYKITTSCASWTSYTFNDHDPLTLLQAYNGIPDGWWFNMEIVNDDSSSPPPDDDDDNDQHDDDDDTSDPPPNGD
ncbi:MAG: hypothetical protein AAFP69_24300, partial [Planctomycetota bacterium]